MAADKGVGSLNVSGARILRSPSHESVTTDLSLLSVSSVASSEQVPLSASCCQPGGGRSRLLVAHHHHHHHHLAPRGPSPNPDSKHHASRRPADIPEMLWFEEETELIKGCAALSSALGLHKSFSTSDISQLPSPPEEHPLRAAVSDLALSWVQRYGYVVGGGRLEAASRSCSTWVAVGDAASQLPSPHAGCNLTAPPQPHHLPLAPPQPAFTPADLVRSVNKKVRQNYIRRRLLTTCRALERLSQSEFDLDRLGAAVAAAAAAASRNEEEDDEEEGEGGGGGECVGRGRVRVPEAALLRAAASASKRGGHHLSLTLTDVERQRGKPLSKYDRNMMIFNWLHTLDDQPPLPPP